MKRNAYKPVLVIALLTFAVAGGLGSATASQEISVISDEPPAPIAPKIRLVKHDTGLPDEERLFHRKEEDLKRLEPSVNDEEQLMLQTVQTLNREAAIRWASGFISEKPLNCPVKRQKEWIEAILFAIERNNLPICKELICLTATIISIESGFRTDPLAFDASRGEDPASLLDRAEKEVNRKYSNVLSLPPVGMLYDSYKEKYYPRVLACRTEGEVEKVARAIADELNRDVVKLPGPVRKAIAGEIEKLVNIVHTKGSMQLNFTRAKQVMTDRGELFTDQELTDYMYTLPGGIDVGVAALRPMFVQYAARYATPGNLSWLFFVGMDYHYGPFSSRNMMEQIRVRDLSGATIPIDGDFLAYDSKARPEPKDSLTLNATGRACPSLARDVILRAFLLEKEPHYIYTEVHRVISDQHERKFGKTPFAVIGDLRMGEAAQVKHGTLFRTKSYLNKLDKFLNSFPWD